MRGAGAGLLANAVAGAGLTSLVFRDAAVWTIFRLAW